MNFINRTSFLIGTFLYCVSFYSSATSYTDYCAGISFRETPYADMYCAKELSYKEAEKIKHFQLEYDNDGRLVELRYVLNNEIINYQDRFVRSPHIKIYYQNNKEVRQFYDQFGARTLVSGEVYEAHFTLDKNNYRKELNFYGLGGKPVNNDFGISRYVWTTLENGDVIERRYNTNNNLIRNRPGFGYQITRFSYNAAGLLTRMYNLGVEGNTLTPDEAGVAMTSINYNQHGQFTGWVNMDTMGNIIKGMSNIAEISYLPSKFASEQVAWFIDQDGKPQNTNWGVHKVAYEFDNIGNQIERKHFNTDEQPTESSSGIHQIKSVWSINGRTKLSDHYYDLKGDKVASSYSGVHAIQTTVDEKERPLSSTFLDMSLNLIVHKGMGYAVETRKYTPEGYLTEVRFTDTDGKPANHAIWQVASFEYQYTKTGDLLSYVARDSAGKETKPIWNPAH